MTERNLIIDNQAQEIFKVNRAAFTDQEIFKLEQEVIFRNCWIYVGHGSEVANHGDFKAREVCGKPVIFCRDTDDKVRVFLNTCPHRGATVCRESEGNRKTFRCFYHAWTFNTKGELVGVPGEDAYGCGFDKHEMGLTEVPRIENYKDFYFINFNQNAEPLVDYLKDAKDYLDLVVEQSPSGQMQIIEGTQEYDIKANWKLLIENSADGYHLMPTHITYIQYLKESNLDMKPVKSKSKAIDLGNGHAVIDSETYRGRPVANWMSMYGDEAKAEMEEIWQELNQRLGEERAFRVGKTDRNLWIFPNLVINDGSSVTVRTFYPTAPDYMKVTAWALGPKEESESALQRRLYGFLSFYGPASFATPDDVTALEMCQKGYGNWMDVQWNDISRGMSKQDPESTDEHQMRTFWRQWIKLIQQSDKLVGNKA